MDDVDAIVITEGQRIPHRLIHKRNNSVDVVWTQVHWYHLTCFSTLYQKKLQKRKSFSTYNEKTMEKSESDISDIPPGPNLANLSGFHHLT